MNFEAVARETIILDPLNDMARKAIPSEIRRDPLTGRTARICDFMELKNAKTAVSEYMKYIWRR